MRGVRAFIKGEVKYSIAFWVYGIFIFVLIRLLAPVLYILSPNVFSQYIDVFKLSFQIIYLASWIVQFFGIWNCSKSSDKLPKIVGRLIFLVLGLGVVLIELKLLYWISTVTY
jgi:hypothetical protein